MLCQEDAERPGPRGAAWEAYRRDVGLRRRLSEAIARRADRNHLVAAMSALQLSETDEVVDPRRPNFNERRDLPGTVGEALNKYLDRLTAERRQRTLALLVALAYAEGSGPTDDRWRAFTEALGYVRPPLEDLDTLRTCGAADYLLQTTAAGAERTTRLFHQALADHLRENRDTRTDQRRLALCLLSELPDGDWSRASEYLRQHGPTHLAAGGLLDEHLTDVRFLLAAHPERLICALPAATSTAARQAAHVYELAFHQLATRPAEERPAYLQLAAVCAGHDALAAALTKAVHASLWNVMWAQWHPPHTHRLLGRHRGMVCSVAFADLKGLTVVVSASLDGTVRVWRLDGGAEVGMPWRGSNRWVSAMAVAELEGCPVVVSGGSEGTVEMWWLDGGGPVGEPWRAHDQHVSAMAVGELEGCPVVVSGGRDGTLRVWRLDTGDPVSEAWRGHDGWVTTVAVGKVGGCLVVVSGGGGDGTMRVWRLDGEAPVEEFWRSAAADMLAVLSAAVGDLDGQPVVISGGGDGTVRVWRLEGGTPVGAPWRGHDSPVDAVAVGELGGHPVAVSGDYDGTVQAWQLDGGTPIGDPWRGHDGDVSALAVAEVDGRPVVVSGGADGTVRMWQLAASAPADQPWSGHDGGVNAVAVGELEGRAVVVSGGNDGTVRIWRLDDGASLGQLWRAPTVWVNEEMWVAWVSSVAVGEFEGRPVVLVGDADGTVRAWRLEGGSPLGEPWHGVGPFYSVAVAALEGLTVVVSGSDDGMVRIWRLDDGAPLGEPWRGHDSPVDAVAVGKLEGRAVVVSGGHDGTRMWSLGDGAPRVELWRGHDGGVNAVAVGILEGCPVSVSGHNDGTVRVRRLDDGAQVGEPWCGHDGGVTALVVGEAEGSPLVVSGGHEGTVRVWRLADGETQQIIDLNSAVRALAFAPPHHIVAGTAMGIVVMQLGGAGATADGR